MFTFEEKCDALTALNGIDDTNPLWRDEEFLSAFSVLAKRMSDAKRFEVVTKKLDETPYPHGTDLDAVVRHLCAKNWRVAFVRGNATPELAPLSTEVPSEEAVYRRLYGTGQLNGCGLRAYSMSSRFAIQVASARPDDLAEVREALGPDRDAACIITNGVHTFLFATPDRMMVQGGEFSRAGVLLNLKDHGIPFPPSYHSHTLDRAKWCNPQRTTPLEPSSETIERLKLRKLLVGYSR